MKIARPEGNRTVARMAEWVKFRNDFLKLSHYPILQDKGKVNALEAKLKAEGTSKMKSKQHPTGFDRSHPAFNENAGPFYRIVMQGLKGDVDGEHFWDAVAENAVFEFRYNIPGFSTMIKGRKAYMDWFGGYANVLHHADHLRVHKSTDPKVVILEYEVHGVVPSTGKTYDNRFCSVITIKNRKIIHWRDYMDSLAVMLAVTRD